MRRLETRLGVRLLHRTTCRVSPTEVGARLAERLFPALGEVQAALDVVDHSRARPAGTLKLNVPGHRGAAGAPPIVAPFLKTCADIRLEVVVVDRFVDLLAAGSDAGIRYDEWLEEHMIAVPTGPRFQRIATAAAPAYLEAHGRPQHPRDLPGQACLRGQLASGAIPTREFERDGEIVRVDPGGPLLVRLGAAMDLAMDTAVEGPGLIHLFEAWLQPHLDSGALEPGLEPWSQRFTGPYLHYPGRRHLPAPLRAFVDFVEAAGGA